MNQTVHNRGLLGSMRGRLLLLVLVGLAPLILVQAGIYAAWYYSNRSEQEQATLREATAVAISFETYVRNVHRQELAIGTALTGMTPHTTEQANAFLETSTRGYPSIRSWNWVGPEGKIIASSQTDALGLNVADRPYFQKLHDGSLSTVSDILTDRISGVRTFVIARRIDDKNRELQGVVFAAVDVVGLGEYLLSPRHGEEGTVTLFDRNGVLVYSSADASAVGQDWRDDDPLLAKSLRSDTAKSGTLVTPTDAQRRIAARVPIGSIGWIAGASRPLALAMKNVIWGLCIAGGLNLLVALVSGGLAWKTRSHLVAQLDKLQSHVQAIGRGDFTHTVDSTGIAELADLATAFNRMGAAVHSAQKAIETAHSQLRTVFDVVNVGMLLIDENGVVQRINHTLSRWVGRDLSSDGELQPGDIIGCVFATTDSAGCGSTSQCPQCALRGAFESVLRTGQAVHDVETEVTLCVGGAETRLWLEVSADPVILDDKRHVILVMNNATVRKQAEAAIQRLASFPTLNPNPIAELDLEGKVHYINPFAEQLFPDLEEKGPTHPWLADWESTILALKNDRKSYSVREVLVDGRWYQQTVHFVEEIERVRLYGSDITSGKQAEAFLRQATEKLARSNKELEQFAYIASHDLQEPLRVITGYVQLIERKYKDRLDADANEFLQYIVDSVKRMQQLITDLLYYSRAGTRSNSFHLTDMQGILKQVLANLENVIEESGATVTHDALPSVQGDPTQLSQLFQNLISNGLKFRGDQPPCIHVSARREDNHWVFAVRDNGIGIEPQYWEQIFVIFQRLHTRHKYPGTGIGLAICKRIVEVHGGRLWLDSEPGRGTIFHLTLPIPEEPL